MSQIEILIAKGEYLEVFSHLKLIPYRVTNSAPWFTIWEFWKGDPKRDNPKELAMIVVKGVVRDAKVFTLQYYPLGEAAQIVEDLSFDKLPEAISLLAQAGFKTA